MSNSRADTAEVRLSEVTELIQYGYTAKSSSLGSGPKYLRITDIQNDQVEWDRVPRVSLDSGDRDRYLLRSGDIVFARSGATVGKSFLIRDNPEQAIFASYLIRVRCDLTQLDPEYAAFFFKSEDYWNQIRAGAAGTGQPNFNGTKLGDLFVPLRSVTEQRLIVAKLRSFLKRSETARRELFRVPRLVERYKLAILGAAFRGELTEAWRVTHSCLRSSAVSVEQKARIGRRREGGSNTTGSSKVTLIPLTWKAIAVEFIGDVILGRQRSPDNHNGPNMRPYVRAANITWAGWDLSDVKEMNFDEADFNKFKLRPGDVLINEGSGSADEVGKPAIWNGEIKNCCFQNTLIAVRPRHATSKYLYFVFLHAALSKAFVDGNERRKYSPHWARWTCAVRYPAPSA